MVFIAFLLITYPLARVFLTQIRDPQFLVVLHEYTVNYQGGYHGFSITSLSGHDDNCRTIEISAGYVIIDIARKPEIGDTILISFCGSLDFAKVQGRALITQDGEVIEGDSEAKATPEYRSIFWNHRTDFRHEIPNTHH